MKHNRTCWSVAGANNLAALLALHHTTGRLRRVLRDWEAHSIAEGSSSIVTLPLSAAKGNRLGEDISIPPHTLSSGEIHPAAQYYLTHFDPLSGMHSYD